MAFAIDAWWDRAVRAREEQVTLRGLQSDFEATLVEIGETRARMDSLAQAAGSLLRLTGPDPSSSPAAEVNRLLADLVAAGAPFVAGSGNSAGVAELCWPERDIRQANFGVNWLVGLSIYRT